MKRVIRILIPILLVLTILLCSAWYLFVYDREFTRDTLISLARISDESGNHSAAAWFYDLAYTHSGDNDAVAIELANQYKENGNYTKAEYTLSNAIIDGGSVDLYVTLSQTYVEQNKLLDAVNMLNSITNQEIKEQIDALRPAAPVPSHEFQPGVYNQYISVPLTADSGSIYFSTTNEYPSVETPAYSKPIPMAAGENVIQAVAVENGLVSPLAKYGYVIGGVIEKVEFVDSAMEALVRKTLLTPDEADLYTDDLWEITTLTVPKKAKSYEDLKYLSKLESLTIQSGDAEQLSHITSLASLKELTIKDTAVSQVLLDSISKFPLLEKLTLSGCSITSISALENATKLKELDLSNNTIRSIDAITAMTSLEVLNISKNVVIDLSALSSVETLKKLDVSYNALTTLLPISGLVNLNLLEANNNAITDLGDIDKLSALTYLNLSYNSLKNVSILASCKELTDLNISSNAVKSIAKLSKLDKLMYFNFSHNSVKTIPAFDKNCALVTIDGSHNKLTSIKNLVGLKNLNNVNVDYNTEITNVNDLSVCPNLIRVDAYGTKVTDVSDLTYQSIIVTYSEVDGKVE